MYTRVLQIFLLVALVASLAGCWNATRQYNKYMALGQQRNVPLLILNTSWNNRVTVKFPGAERPLDVALLNTGHSRINSVDLYVTYCPYGSAQSRDHVEIPYAGPILPGRSYLGRYSAPVGLGRAEHSQGLTRYGPVVIRAVKVRYADGAQSTYEKNVARLLAPNITNYCRSDWNGTPPLSSYAGSG